MSWRHSLGLTKHHTMKMHGGAVRISMEIKIHKNDKFKMSARCMPKQLNMDQNVICEVWSVSVVIFSRGKWLHWKGSKPLQPRKWECQDSGRIQCSHRPKKVNCGHIVFWDTFRVIHFDFLPTRTTDYWQLLISIIGMWVGIHLQQEAMFTAKRKNSSSKIMPGHIQPKRN